MKRLNRLSAVLQACLRSAVEFVRRRLNVSASAFAVSRASLSVSADLNVLLPTGTRHIPIEFPKLRLQIITV